MKILTLNTWQEEGPWKERWEVILAGIERFRPDIAAFQELFNREWALEIQKRTGFQTFLFPEAFCGLVVFTRYPVVSWGVEELVQSPLEEYRRYLLWGEFDVSGHRLLFLNTHLSWKLEDGVTRVKQTKEILRFVEKKSPKGEGVLVGDLNAPPHSPEIKQLMGEGKFLDLFHHLHQFQEKFTWDNRNPYAGGSKYKMPDRRIDFVLARNSNSLLANPISCEVIFTEPTPQGVYASDHSGVLVEFR